MGRLGQVGSTIAVLCAVVAGELGCSSSAVNTVSFAVPARIVMVPAPSVSMELGTNQQFAATPQNSSNAPIAEPIFYESSNSAVVTVASNGLVCAGTWDSLTAPQICTPGPVGFADITGNTQGVTSPPTRVYVHQHIDSVALSPVLPGPASCLSVDQTAIYQAKAYSRGIDVTGTVGQFAWQMSNVGVASLSTTANGLSNIVNGQSLNQVQMTAKLPGLTPLFAFIGNTSSVSINFNTCRVQSIQLDVTGSSVGSKIITPTVVDILGTTITGVPLTWSSSEPGSVGVSTTGTATAVAGGGGATIIASCTPPACNIGISPSLPIFPENVVTLVAPAGTSASATVYVSSSGCGAVDDCISTVVPVTTPANTLGNAIALPATPNSLVFDRVGAKAYLGTNAGLLGSKGLAVIDTGGSTASLFAGLTGKVLAVSPDSSRVVISDTTDLPNQVFVFNTANNAVSPFRVTGATAADFSPDSLKAFIVAGSTLYVYSKVDAWQTKSLAAPANDVTFLAEGAFAYLAGGDPAGVTVKRTCDIGSADTVNVSPVPTFLRTLPGQAQLLNGDPGPPDDPLPFHLIGLAPPVIEIISAHPPTKTSWTGCTPAVVDDDPVPVSFDLGRGSFVASQLIISQDGSTAYIVSPNFNSILVFNIGAQTSSAIPLAGGGTPLHASLTPDGTRLFVGSSDGTLHILQTDTGTDVQQITFPDGLCQNSAGQRFLGVTCNPDFVAVKP